MEDENKLPKVKSSFHHEDRLWDPKYPKHDLPIEGCEYVIRNPTSITKQANGRYMYLGPYLGQEHEVVVCATTSGIVEVDRVVTAYNLEDWDPPVSIDE